MMTGAVLSRWTISYFVVACLFLLAGQVLFLVGFANPLENVQSPPVLAAVHLLTAGWLGLLMTGASLQFVPVIAAVPLQLSWLALPALLLIAIGDLALVSGFILLDFSAIAGLLLTLGGLCLGLGYGAIAVLLVLTLATAQVSSISARFVGLGIVGLVITAAAGIAMVSGFAGVPFFAERIEAILPFHMVSGFGLYLTLSALGVGYKLLPMFLITVQPAGRRPLIALSAAIALSLAIACGLVGSAGFGLDVGRIWMIALGVSLAGLAVYAADLVRILRARRRKVLELNTVATILAFLQLYAVVVWLPVSAVLGRLEQDLPALLYLVGFGWLTGLGLGQLYKIVPFMTWLEVYGPHLGKMPTPRVQDLVREPEVKPFFWIFHLGVLIATLGIVCASSPLFRTGLAAQSIATLCLMMAFVRARRLSNIEEGLRPPLPLKRL